MLTPENPKLEEWGKFSLNMPIGFFLIKKQILKDVWNRKKKYWKPQIGRVKEFDYSFPPTYHCVSINLCLKHTTQQQIPGSRDR